MDGGGLLGGRNGGREGRIVGRRLGCRVERRGGEFVGGFNGGCLDGIDRGTRVTLRDCESGASGSHCRAARDRDQTAVVVPAVRWSQLGSAERCPSGARDVLAVPLPLISHHGRGSHLD